MCFTVFTRPLVSHQAKNTRLKAAAKQERYSSLLESQHLGSALLLLRQHWVSGISHPHRWKPTLKWQCLLCMHLPCLTQELCSKREREVPALWWSWCVCVCVFANMVLILYSARNYISPIFLSFFIVSLSLPLCWIHKQLGWIKHFNDP